MKVLYLIDTLEVGGTEQSLLAIARHFRDTEAVICHVYQGSTLRAAYEAAGIPVISLGVEAHYGFVEAIRSVRKLLKTLRPDVLHVNLFRSGVIGRVAGRLEGVPVVDSFVNDSYAETRIAGLGAGRVAKLRAVQVLDALTARWVRRFTSNSHAVARSNARALGVPSHRITVIHRGRDPRPYACGAVEPAMLEGGDGSEIVFLNVGRLLERKGQAELLQAFGAVRAQCPDAHLFIAGEGAYREELEALRGHLGLGDHVHLLGQRSDIPALLAAADVFVFPSHYEGHSGALIEAMFAQRPIVATDIPENRESVEHGLTALLVPPRNPEALAQAMFRMVEQPAEAHGMAKEARRVAMERFDIRQIAEQHEALYRSVVMEAVR